MASSEEAPHHVCAHSSKTHHSQLHRSLPLRVASLVLSSTRFLLMLAHSRLMAEGPFALQGKQSRGFNTARILSTRRPHDVGRMRRSVSRSHDSCDSAQTLASVRLQALPATCNFISYRISGFALERLPCEGATRSFGTKKNGERPLDAVERQ